MIRRFREHLRREFFWERVIAAGIVVRIVALIALNPMDRRVSDAMRHWENGVNLLNPGPMGAADPFFYQLWIYFFHTVFGGSRAVWFLVAATLSLGLPASWYLFAKNILQTRLALLVFVAFLTCLPTFIFGCTFFMNETLLMPTIGCALWCTWRAREQPTPGRFLVASTLWCVAALTRSVAVPFAIVALAGLVWAQRRRVWPVLLAASIWAGGLTAASLHSYPHFKRYSPFGNFNQFLPIYFLSTADTYKVHFKGSYTYYFQSPSYLLSPFFPIPWETSRKGTYEFTMDPERHGDDLVELRNQLLAEHWTDLPWLIGENVIFLLFGYSWPESDGSVPIGTPIIGGICLQERFIWCPIIVMALYFCIRSLRREGFQFFPFITVAFVVVLFSLQLAPMEGRYRKPIEPLVLLAAIWGWEKRVRERSSLEASGAAAVVHAAS